MHKKTINEFYLKMREKNDRIFKIPHVFLTANVFRKHMKNLLETHGLSQLYLCANIKFCFRICFFI